MPRLLITTIGTSLLTNRDEGAPLPRRRPWAPWHNKQPLPDAGAVDAWLAGADPIQASAETNTFRGLELGENDRVRLLPSDTPEGRFCAERLASWLDSRCREVGHKHLASLNYGHQSFAQRGLKSLIVAAVEEVQSARHLALEPVFCATGGFKAEIAFLNVLGALLGVEVVYIHEQFRELVRLPRLPLSWDAHFVEARQDFFVWIDAEPRPAAQVEARLAGRPELRSLVVDDPDGCVYLSAAGNLLWSAAQEQLAARPRANWPKADPRPPGQKDGLSEVEHHRPKGWEAFVDRLCRIDCVSRVVYDPAAHGGERVKSLDPTKGVIGVRFGPPDHALPLRVETTARGESECDLVANYLQKLQK